MVHLIRLLKQTLHSTAPILGSKNTVVFLEHLLAGCFILLTLILVLGGALAAAEGWIYAATLLTCAVLCILPQMPRFWRLGILALIMTFL